MKYDINNLYFARCRRCIMDIINVTDENGHLMFPHPDYIDYYTILLFKNNKYISIYNKNIIYKPISQVDKIEDYYDGDIVMKAYSLINYIDTEYKKISAKECQLIGNTIKKTKGLKKKYGYKNNH